MLLQSWGGQVEGGSVESRRWTRARHADLDTQENKNGPVAAIPWWYWPSCRSSVAGRDCGCVCVCRRAGERPVSTVEFQADQGAERLRTEAKGLDTLGLARLGLTLT